MCVSFFAPKCCTCLVCNLLVSEHLLVSLRALLTMISVVKIAVVLVLWKLKQFCASAVTVMFQSADGFKRSQFTRNGDFEENLSVIISGIIDFY